MNHRDDGTGPAFDPCPRAPLTLETVVAASASRDLRAEVLELCGAAYDEDLTDYLRYIGSGTHVLGREGERLVTHAMWVTRWL